MAHKAIVNHLDEVTVFREEEPNTPLYLSDEQYYVSRSLEDGESDLERLAGSKLEEEGCWLFSHFDQEWYNLRIHSGEYEEEDSSGVMAEVLLMPPSNVGQKTTMYHIHPFAGFKHDYELLQAIVEEPKVLEMMGDITVEEAYMLTELQLAFLTTIPSDADIEAMARYQMLTDSMSDFEFKIVSPFGISTLEVDLDHPDLNLAFHSFQAVGDELAFPPYDAAEQILKMINTYPEETGRVVHFDVLEAIQVKVVIHPDYVPGSLAKEVSDE